MAESTWLLIQLVGRLAVILLCYVAVTKLCQCGRQCSKVKQSVKSVLGWISGAVACAGLFYPVVGGVLAIMLVLALWLTEVDYEKATGRLSAKATAASDARGSIRR